MRDACKEAGVLSIPWIRPDLTTVTPPFGTREYGLTLVERVKVTLGELQAKGEMEKDGVYFY